MNKLFALEILIALLLGSLVAMLTYANDVWMLDMRTILILAGAVVVFGVFAVFVWKESGGDEREAFIRAYAARWAFLVTGAVLLIGIMSETLTNYMPSPWLGLAFMALIASKIIGQAYGHRIF